MIPFSYSYRFLRKTRQFLFRKGLLICLLLLPVIVSGQVVIDTITPMDLQLIPRNLSNPNINKGEVHIKGYVDNSGGGFDYDKINVRVYKSSSLALTDFSNTTAVSDDDYNLPGGTIRAFDITVLIPAETMNYSFRIGFKKNGVYALAQEKDIYNVVSGDVFVIQGQSNALAAQKPTGDPANAINKNIFIRSFSNPHPNGSKFLQADQLIWTEAQGDVYVDNANGNGMIGQWGLKLGNILVNRVGGIPVAIINGAEGNSAISLFKDDAPPRSTSWDYNIHDRLWLRLQYAGLRNNVRAIFWSQGENDVSTTTSSYVSTFNEISGDVKGWKFDYPNIEKIYIFQTKSGCDLNLIGVKLNTFVKEAQRQLADDSNNFIDIIPTTSIDYLPNEYGCHFNYSPGYEDFASRLFKLVDRDFYGGSYSSDIEPPMPQIAYLSAPNEITLETDANSLHISNAPVSFDDFEINNATTNITDISTDGFNKIRITFSGSISGDETLTYVGLGAGENDTSFIMNSQNLELVCFDKFPLDTSLKTIWDGSKWAPATPIATMDAEINGTFNESDGNITSRDLLVKSGKTVNFDNGGGNYIEVHGNLIIDGSMTIGDKESLVIPNNSSSAAVTGSFAKKEKSTVLKNKYDVTYWSSPVQNSSLSAVFPGVDANRIFEYDPNYINPAYTGAYQKYRHWHIASGLMEIGKGYSVDGRTNMTSPEQMNVEFTGIPNHGDIPVSISKYTTIDGDFDKTNLLGNPYPSAIDADLLITENNSIFEGTLYLWDHSENYVTGEYTAEYLTYNLGGAVPSNTPVPYYIASGQGFMILTNESSAQFNFLSSMQVAGNNDVFYKKSNKEGIINSNGNKVWLQISQENIPKKEILLGFSEAATKGFDKGYDGKLLNTDGAITFYSLIDSTKYVIQGLGSRERDRKVDIGFSASDIGTYSIGISKVEGGLRKQSVYLVDKVLNIWHDLSLGDYNFDQNETGDFPNRFFIRFDDSSFQEDRIISSPDFIITAVEGGYEVTSGSIIEKIELYNIMGQLIYRGHGKSNHIHLSNEDLNIGTILLINVTFNNGTMKNRKVFLY